MINSSQKYCSGNIHPYVLANKDEYGVALDNIEYSLSGIIEESNCNMFILEAVQQLRNAIVLFEQGYFDCAYYALRSSIELATSMVYLFDVSDGQKNNINAWKSAEEYFPTYGKMMKKLSKQGSMFADLKEKMADFFVGVDKLNSELNKYVHKQGFQNFYVWRRCFACQSDERDAFVKRFKSCLERCIGVTAVMRLAIDPFPILLLDREILYRYADSITEPYDEEFVKKYIGQAIIDQYIKTELYRSLRTWILEREEMNEAVFNIMRYQYIDTKRVDEIFKQQDLLTKDDIICVLLAVTCEKVVKVRCYGGLFTYNTDRKMNKLRGSVWEWDAEEFKRLSEANDKMNQKYHNTYMSVIFLDNMQYFVEHNEILTSSEIEKLMGIAVDE